MLPKMNIYIFWHRAVSTWKDLLMPWLLWLKITQKAVIPNFLSTQMLSQLLIAVNKYLQEQNNLLLAKSEHSNTFFSPFPTPYQKKVSSVLLNKLDEFVYGNTSDTVFLFKDASVWFHHLCKTSALQNKIPKRSVHYWGESHGYFVTSLDKLVALEDLLECLCKTTLWTKVFCSPHLPPPKEVYNREPACFGERQLLSHKLGCGHFQLFAISAFKTHLDSHLVLLSGGWKNCFWFPPSVYTREILQIPTQFWTSKVYMFNKGTVTN